MIRHCQNTSNCNQDALCSSPTHKNHSAPDNTAKKSQSYRILVICPYMCRGQHIRNRLLLIAGEDVDRPLGPVCQGKRQEVSCIVGPLSAPLQFMHVYKEPFFCSTIIFLVIVLHNISKSGKILLSSRKSHRQCLNSWAVMPSIWVDAASKKQLPSAVI